MNLPKLPRQLIRPDKELQSDPEIWFPTWHCFCCHDSGLVRPKLVELVIPDYDYDKDLHPACYRCEAGSIYTHCEEYDQRFNRDICRELDRIEREIWTATVKEKQQRLLEAKMLAQEMSMRLRDGREANRLRHRTGLEEELANRRHEEILNADPQWLLEMARIYLGDEWMEDGST